MSIILPKFGWTAPSGEIERVKTNRIE